MLKLTLDTNCVINLLDRMSDSAISIEQISEIFRYGLEGDVNIAITTRVENDIESDSNEERKREMLKRISMFPAVGTIARWDISKFDSGDVFSGTQHLDLQSEIQKILFPGLKSEDTHFKNKINDVDHLVGHCLNKRDIFITDDKEILKKSDILKNSFGIIVLNPQKSLEYINLKADKTVLIKQFHENIVSFRDLILLSLKQNMYEFKEPEKYDELRNWLLQKYPIVKDGLLKFKLGMMSVPAGGNQLSYNQGDLLDLRSINESIQYLFNEDSCKEQLFLFKNCSNEDEYTRYSGLQKREITEKFKPVIDLLISQIGYLENNY